LAEPYTPKDQLSVWWLADPANPKLVGEVALAQSGRGVTLRYAPAWLQSGFPLSEDLPLSPELFVSSERDVAPGAIDDARPDRWGERVIRKFENSPRLSLLEHLLFAGDDRFGALGISQQSDAYAPWSRSPMPSFDMLEEMAEVIRMVLANEPVPELQRRLVRPGASLGGARPKSLVSINGEPWLVKFSEGEEIDTPLVEHACMQFARGCEIETASTRIFKVGGAHAVAIRRFDRAGAGRIHAMSARVALRAAGEEFGYPQLAQLLRRVAPAKAIAAQQEQLFRRMVFNILIDNTDDHEKNHALLRHEDGYYLLAPAFDIVPSAQGLGYQQLLVGEQATESTLDNALSRANEFGLKPAAARGIVEGVCLHVAGWKENFRSAGVIDRDIQLLAQYIDSERLGRQRDAFARRGRSGSA
jgi:serine/threonine-protein kinase HipA